MQDFALVNNDLAVDNSGNFILVTDAYCISQMIDCALKLFIGEYEYNQTLGISWVVALEFGFTQIPLIEYQLTTTVYNLNNYITQPDLKITNVTALQAVLNQQRSLSITGTVILANQTVIEVQTNV